VGNIEMHVHADDWYAHGHETDPAYENVILLRGTENSHPLPQR
jgi:hypothetical protein